MDKPIIQSTTFMALVAAVLIGAARWQGWIDGQLFQALFVAVLGMLGVGIRNAVSRNTRAVKGGK